MHYLKKFVSAHHLMLFVRTLKHVNLNQFLTGKVWIFRCFDVSVCIANCIYLYFAFLLAACILIGLICPSFGHSVRVDFIAFIIIYLHYMPLFYSDLVKYNMYVCMFMTF